MLHVTFVTKNEQNEQKRAIRLFVWVVTILRHEKNNHQHNLLSKYT